MQNSFCSTEAKSSLFSDQSLAFDSAQNIDCQFNFLRYSQALPRNNMKKAKVKTALRLHSMERERNQVKLLRSCLPVLYKVIDRYQQHQKSKQRIRVSKSIKIKGQRSQKLKRVQEHCFEYKPHFSQRREHTSSKININTKNKGDKNRLNQGYSLGWPLQQNILKREMSNRQAVNLYSLRANSMNQNNQNIMNFSFNQQQIQAPEQKNISYENGDQYIGNLKQGVPNGEGIYKFVDGDFYIGNFVNGVKEGFGTYHSREFVRKGQWRLDNMLQGFEFNTDNTIYQGQFRNGLYQGVGMLITPQYTYTGGFKTGKKHGGGGVKEKCLTYSCVFDNDSLSRKL